MVVTFSPTEKKETQTARDPALKPKETGGWRQAQALGTKLEGQILYIPVILGGQTVQENLHCLRIELVRTTQSSRSSSTWLV